MDATQGPFQGVRMIDLATAIAGPFAGSLMADQGADVIKVETPGFGDILRYVGASRGGVSALYSMTNRGKRSLALNLKSDEGIAILKSLVAGADVVLHNFRPGVAERLGIAYEDLCEVKPDLIYVSVTGFGHEGPDAGKRAYDNVIQAFSGLAFNQASPETGEPVQNYQAIADKLTALTAAQAIGAALYARAQGRGGQHIRLNMVDSVVHFLWMDAAGTASFIGDGADPGVQVAKGVPLIRFRNGWAQAAPLSDAEFFGLFRAFGIDLSDEPRVHTVVERMQNREVVVELMGRLYSIAADMDVDEGVRRMEVEDVPCAKAMKIEELPGHPQLQANGTFVRCQHPMAGEMQEPRPAALFGATPAGVAGPCASLGQHTAEILSELGLAERLDELRAAGVVA